MANKPTAAEKILRIQTVYGLLVNGESRANILRHNAEKWGVSERTTDAYLQEARELIEKDCDLSRPAFLAETLAGLREVRTTAARRGQMQVVVNAIRLQAELVGLTNKSQ